VPALPSVPAVIRCDILWQIGDDIEALTRLHINYTGTPPNDATAAALAQLLYVIFGAEFLTYVVPANKMLGVRVTDLSSPTGGQGEYLLTTPGTLSSTDVPAGTALLVNAHIQRRYRGGKPRSYLPLGGGSELSSPSTWDSGFLANVQAALNAIVADIAVCASGGCALGQLVSIPYYHGFVAAENPVTHRWRNIPVLAGGTPVPDLITSWVANPKPSSQRRRNLHTA